MSTYQILLIVHIACVAVWFGVSLSVPGWIRRGMSLGKTEMQWMTDEVGRTLRVSLIFGVLTIVSGFVIIFYKGGFGTVSKYIHIGLGVTFLMVIHEFFVMQTIWKRLRKVLVEGGDRALIPSLRIRLTISRGVHQLLWLMVLLLMLMQRAAETAF